ncbi:MAG: P1 family peptidase [Eubacteriales bacterium]
MLHKGNITDVPNIEAGHFTDDVGKTGCTVVVCNGGAVCGVDVRGSAPGTRETDLLKSENLVERVHAVVLSGGSAFGLESACGVMDYLRDSGIGLDTGFAKVPIVPAAVLFDLGVGSPNAFPDKLAGYKACKNASTDELPQGRVGAGTGATVGKALGAEFAQMGGIGTCSMSFSNGVIIGALTAVNALGDVVDEKGSIIAGAYKDGFLNIRESMKSAGETHGIKGANTTIGVLATNAKLTKVQANKLASVCQDGLAMSIRPCHTMYDGDTYFAMSTGDVEMDFTRLCSLAAECVSKSIENAVRAAND